MKVYECWGGPMDGKTVSIPDTSTSVRVPLPPARTLVWREVNELKPSTDDHRVGEYRLQRRSDGQIFLRWEGE